MTRKPRTSKQLDQWADSRERFLGIERERLTLAQRRKLRADTINQEKARLTFEGSAEGQRFHALEDQRIEVLAEIEAVEALPTVATNKHRRLAELEKQLAKIKGEIQRIAKQGSASTRQQAASPGIRPTQFIAKHAAHVQGGKRYLDQFFKGKSRNKGEEPLAKQFRLPQQYGRYNEDAIIAFLKKNDRYSSVV